MSTYLLLFLFTFINLFTEIVEYIPIYSFLRGKSHVPMFLYYIYHRWIQYHVFVMFILTMNIHLFILCLRQWFSTCQPWCPSESLSMVRVTVSGCGLLFINRQRKPTSSVLFSIFIGKVLTKKPLTDKNKQKQLLSLMLSHLLQ